MIQLHKVAVKNQCNDDVMMMVTTKYSNELHFHLRLPFPSVILCCDHEPVAHHRTNFSKIGQSEQQSYGSLTITNIQALNLLTL